MSPDFAVSYVNRISTDNHLQSYQSVVKININNLSLNCYDHHFTYTNSFSSHKKYGGFANQRTESQKGKSLAQDHTVEVWIQVCHSPVSSFQIRPSTLHTIFQNACSLDVRILDTKINKKETRWVRAFTFQHHCPCCGTWHISKLTLPPSLPRSLPLPLLLLPSLLFKYTLCTACGPGKAAYKEYVCKCDHIWLGIHLIESSAFLSRETDPGAFIWTGHRRKSPRSLLIILRSWRIHTKTTSHFCGMMQFW